MEIRVLDNNYCTNVCICCIHHLRFGRDSRMELLRGRSGRKLKQTEFVTLCVLSPYLYHFTFHFEYKYIFLSILLLYRFFLSFFFTDTTINNFYFNGDSTCKFVDCVSRKESVSEREFGLRIWIHQRCILFIFLSQFVFVIKFKAIILFIHIYIIIINIIIISHIIFLQLTNNILTII